MFNYSVHWRDISVHWRDIEPRRGNSAGWLRQSQSTPTRMSDTQQHKDPRETYPINSASEDNEATLRPTKKISPPAKQETALRTQKHSAPQLQPTLGRNQQPRANQQLSHQSSDVEEEHSHHNCFVPAQGGVGLVRFGELTPPELFVLKSELFYWWPPG